LLLLHIDIEQEDPKHLSTAAECSMNATIIREAVAVFDNAEKLEAAVSELQSKGFDRSDLSFLAHETVAERRPLREMRGIADDPTIAREPVISDTDVRQGRVLGTSLAATIAGLAAAGFTVATGGVAAVAIAAAAAAAGGIGTAGVVFGRTLADDQASFLDAQLARGGVLLWIRTRDVTAECNAMEILRRYATHVHLHDLSTGAALGGSQHRVNPNAVHFG
jgi:hypothetical protein